MVFINLKIKINIMINSVLLIHFILSATSWLKPNFSLPMKSLYTITFFINLSLFFHQLTLNGLGLHIAYFLLPMFGYCTASVFKEFVFIQSPLSLKRLFTLSIISGCINIVVFSYPIVFTHFFIHCFT